MKFFSLFVLVAFSTIVTVIAAQPKLHPIEKVCVMYEMSGQIQNGSITRCHREYGYEQYEIQNITIGIAGFTQTQNSHNITIGDTIYAIDLENNTGTKTKNPMYQSIVSAMEDNDSEEMSDTFITAMGYSPTGETKTIADNECDVYDSGQAGTICLTSSGLMLEQTILGNSTTAASVSIGESGEDTNYILYEQVSITEGPDLSNLFNQQ